MQSAYQFPLGAFTGYVFADNSRPTAVADMFPSVHPGLVKEALDALGYQDDHIEVGYNVLLIDTGQRKVLIDAGTGQGNLLAGLATAGFQPTDIDTLIVTHGDGDHIGGLEQYPRARIILTEQVWRMWTTSAGLADMVSQFSKLFRANMDAEKFAAMEARRAAYGREVLPRLRSRIDLVAPETEFLPGFRLVPAPGHRSDHTAVEISSDGATLLHIVDSLRHPVQTARLTWTSYIDSFPGQLVASNNKLFGRAAAKNALVFATHMPFPGLGHITAHHDHYHWADLAPSAPQEATSG